MCVCAERGGIVKTVEGLPCDTKPMPFWCQAHDKSLGTRRMVIATGTNVQRGSEC